MSRDMHITLFDCALSVEVFFTWLMLLVLVRISIHFHINKIKLCRFSLLSSFFAVYAFLCVIELVYAKFDITNYVNTCSLFAKFLHLVGASYSGRAVPTQSCLIYDAFTSSVSRRLLHLLCA